MAENSKIEWTDHTWNPVTGCAVVSPGCTNCYAMKLAGTRLRNHKSRAGLTRPSKAGPVWTGEVRFNDEWLDQPLRWRKPARIFVCAHGDLFAEGVPDEWIDRVFAIMALCPLHEFQVLTKRPDRMRDYLKADDRLERVSHWQNRIEPGLSVYEDVFRDAIWPLPNVWLGVSVEDQARADERIPILLNTPAAIRWISAEPLLGWIDLRCLHYENITNIDALAGKHGLRFAHDCPRLDWIVAGGESGPGARPMHPDWPRSLRDQCAAAGVPFLFKQWGAYASATIDETLALNPPLPANGLARMKIDQGFGFRSLAKDETVEQVFRPGTAITVPCGKARAGRLLDGRLHDDYPGRP